MQYGASADNMKYSAAESNNNRMRYYLRQFWQWHNTINEQAAFVFTYLWKT